MNTLAAMVGTPSLPPCCTVEVATPVGPARTHTQRPYGRPPTATLVLGHGAGGGVAAPDLLAASEAALTAGLRVVRVEQPWRVAGRRIAVAPPRLDAAWLAVVAGLEEPGPLVLGGRSAGARVACRTASQLGAVAVLALAFPLRTARADRLGELQAPTVPRLVVQGARDGFGVPACEPGVQVHVVAGADHGFAVRRQDGRTPAQVHEEVRATVQDWLTRTLRQTLT